MNYTCSQYFRKKKEARFSVIHHIWVIYRLNFLMEFIVIIGIIFFSKHIWIIIIIITLTKKIKIKYEYLPRCKTFFCQVTTCTHQFHKVLNWNQIICINIIKVRILFEEAFYNNNDESYQVFCIEYFLNKPPPGKYIFCLIEILDSWYVNLHKSCILIRQFNCILWFADLDLSFLLTLTLLSFYGSVATVLFWFQLPLIFGKISKILLLYYV